MTNKNRCPECGHIIDKREINMFKGLATALWQVYKWCKEKGRHEFKMNEVRDMLGRNEYARFGDWVLFGGLVYKNSKAHYGLNMERCAEFFKGTLQIPLSLWKDPITGKVSEKGEYGTIHEIKGLITFLDDDYLYQAQYKPRATLL